MRLSVFIAVIVLAGCQSADRAPSAALPPVTPPPPSAPNQPPAEQPTVARRQAQLIEALINQNEALAQRLASNGTTVPPPSPLPPRRVERAPATVPGKPYLVPNGDGFVDLRAPEGKADEPVNPFDVPRSTDGKGHEVTISVSGIIAGAETYAVINDRTVQTGDVIETLTVESIGKDGVYLALGERRVKLAVSETPVRVRLPD